VLNSAHRQFHHFFFHVYVQLGRWWPAKWKLSDPRACTSAAVWVCRRTVRQQQESSASEPCFLAFSLSTWSTQVVLLCALHCRAHQDAGGLNQSMCSISIYSFSISIYLQSINPITDWDHRAWIKSSTNIVHNISTIIICLKSQWNYNTVIILLCRLLLLILLYSSIDPIKYQRSMVICYIH
jgi:hypothetical protein